MSCIKTGEKKFKFPIKSIGIINYKFKKIKYIKNGYKVPISFVLLSVFACRLTVDISHV